jgi:hypothetical protein
MAPAGICDAILSLPFIPAVNESPREAFFTGICGSNEPLRTEKGWRIWFTQF